jgi:hypothetical protein
MGVGATMAKAIQEKPRITIDIVYGDHEGGQRVITRFVLTRTMIAGWRPWNLDRPEPR